MVLLGKVKESLGIVRIIKLNVSVDETQGKAKQGEEKRGDTMQDEPNLGDEAMPQGEGKSLLVPF